MRRCHLSLDFKGQVVCLAVCWHCTGLSGTIWLGEMEDVLMKAKQDQEQKWRSIQCAQTTKTYDAISTTSLRYMEIDVGGLDLESTLERLRFVWERSIHETRAEDGVEHLRMGRAAP